MTKLTPAVKERIADLSKKKIGIIEIGNIIQEEMSVNISARSIKRIRQEFGVQVRGKNKPKSQPKPFKADTKFNQDGSQVHTTLVQMDEEMLKDPAFVLRAHGYDPDAWELTQHVHNVWQQNSVADGMKDLHQSKVTVKPKTGFSIETVIKCLAKSTNPIKLKLSKSILNKNLVLPFADLHFGITKMKDVERHLEVMIPILETPHKTVVIEQLGDLFHSSQMWSTQTMKGTMLDEVNMVEAIEAAKSFFDNIIMHINANKIIVKQIAGNHSGNMEYMFMEYLKAKYPDIKIDNNIKYRDAYLLDDVGIMMAHGDFARKGLVSIFPNEFKSIWGQSNQVYIHSGHFHTQKTTDEGGIIWQQFGTIKPNDNYEISNGWTLSKKSLYLLEYDKNSLIAEYYV